MSTTLLCWCRNDSDVTQAAHAFPADYRYSGCRRSALPQTLGRLSGDDVLALRVGSRQTPCRIQTRLDMSCVLT